ncbi:hypothetical protein KTR10_02075 [Candidatus Kaiserbacteria bacterium]|nr:hypothetical protein [Candidatus Kaiserbacteria bacterium]
MKIADKIGEMLGLLSHMHSAADVLSAFRGEKPANDASAIAKGVYGLRGGEDERQFNSIMLKVSEIPGLEDAFDIFAEFHKWASLKGGTLEEYLINLFCWNEFRLFVVKRGPRTIKPKVAEATFSMEGRNGSSFSVTARESADVQTELKSRFGNESIHFQMKEPPRRTEKVHEGVIFMEYVIRTIKESPTPLAGYKRLAKQFKSQGILLPIHPNQKTKDLVAKAINSVRSLPQRYDKATNRLANQIEQKIADSKKDHGPLRKFFNAVWG